MEVEDYQPRRGSPRGLGRTQAEVEFDADAEEQSEVLCINVSPFTARFEIGTVPGSKPRRYTIAPGGRVYLQYGYCITFLGASRKPVKPTIEALTEREAWPGVRHRDDASGAFVWQVKPGPRLPMVVAETRASEVKQAWDAAMAAKVEAQNLPLRMKLQRVDGTSVEVEAAIEPSIDRVPMRQQNPPPVHDDEDQGGGQLDEPPPDDDEPPAPVVLPPAKPDKEPASKRGK